MHKTLSDRMPHPLSGQDVKIKLHRPHLFGQIKDGDTFTVEDWWENVTGKRWTVDVLGGNPAALLYASRAVETSDKLYKGFEPVQDVVYGNVGSLGHILHNSELVTC